VQGGNTTVKFKVPTEPDFSEIAGKIQASTMLGAPVRKCHPIDSN